MTSIGLLSRLEPRARSASLAPGLAAPIYDPLWLLSRQLAVGELDGDGGGSLIESRVRGTVARLTHYVPPDGRPRPYDAGALPLDAVVEATPVRGAQPWTARLRVDVGRALVAALRGRAAGAEIAAFVSAFGIARASVAFRAVDPAGARLLDVAAGRLPDGEQMYRQLVPDLRTGVLPQTPALPSGATQRVLDAELDWLRWLDTTLIEPAAGADTWSDARMEYDFAVEARAPAATQHLRAPDYRGGELEWWAFDMAAPTAGDPGAPATADLDLVLLPTPVRFRGMPAARYWEMEENEVDLGAIDAAPSDLARMALLEFGLVFGNDFYAVPVQLPVGTLTTLGAVIVTDTFGARILIRPSAAPAARRAGQRWTMFTLGAPAGAVADALLLAPGAAERLEGRPLEEVQMLRDEMANLAWAIEHRVEGEAGGSVSRSEEDARLAPEPDSPPPAGTPLRYRLGTSVPRHWFPLVPIDTGAGELALEVQRMGDGGPEPRGRLLPPLGRRVDERELPREGLRLSRRAASTRWTGGQGVAFVRRERRVGRGEGSSGLAFDVVAPEE